MSTTTWAPLSKTKLGRVRDSKGVGEVDLRVQGYLDVLLPGRRGGLERVLVKVQTGDAKKGKGVILDKPKNPEFKFGQIIRFGGGNENVRPKFLSRCHERSQGEELIKNVAEELKQAMTFRPETAKPELVLTLDQAAKYFAVTNLAAELLLRHRPEYHFNGVGNWVPATASEIESGFRFVEAESDEMEKGVKSEFRHWRKQFQTNREDRIKQLREAIGGAITVQVTV